MTGAGAVPASSATGSTPGRGARALQHETRELRRQILELVRELAPAPMHEPGVGPISAAHLIIAWSHPQRFRTEAAFAMLAGTSPVPASSGQTVRHRLNRGGDRRLNRALHTVLARRAAHEPTRVYLERRIGQGKSKREAVRCLKRYLSRRLYRVLGHSHPDHRRTTPGDIKP